MDEGKKYFPMGHLHSYLSFIFTLLISRGEKKDCDILPHEEKRGLIANDLESFWALWEV